MGAGMSFLALDHEFIHQTIHMSLGFPLPNVLKSWDATMESDNHDIASKTMAAGRQFLRIH